MDGKGLSILLIVYTNILHDNVLNITQHCVQFCVQYYWHIVHIVHIARLQFIVRICQFCTILPDIVREIALVWFADAE